MPVAALALAACAAIALGCGEDSGSSEDASEASTALTITLDPDGDGPEEPLSAEAGCPGGDTAVCDAVASVPDDPGAPVDPSTPCTEIYGGPDELAVEGTLRGEPIDATLTRESGCEIDRFERFLPLLEAVFPDYQPGSAIGA